MVLVSDPMTLLKFGYHIDISATLSEGRIDFITLCRTIGFVDLFRDTVCAWIHHQFTAGWG